MLCVCDEIQKTNDVIEALYYSSEGRFFRDYYASWIVQHKSEDYVDYLYILSSLTKIGISRIPLVILGSLIPTKAQKFQANDFLASYPDLLQESNGYVKLLRSRIIGATIKANDLLVKDAIYALVKYTLGLFTEGDISEYYELFQKALRVKRLISSSILSLAEIEKLFVSLEKDCASISYFWVQYGLIEQENKDFEGANNHFLYAKSIRSNSYQVAHALAKNRMEMGLFELRKRNDAADDIFWQGCSEMENIINDPRYSKAFNYSVHSYANLLMKFYNTKNDVIPEGQCQALNTYFKMLLERQIDYETKEIILKYIQYCKTHGITQFCEGLDCAENVVTYVHDSENDFDVY